MIQIFTIIMLLCALSCSENDDSANTEKIFVNDIEREYILYIPESYDGNSKLPILLNFHGGIDNYYYSIDDIHEYWINQNVTNKVSDKISFNSNGQTIEYHSYKNGINNTSIDHYKVIGGEHWWLDIEYEGLNTNRIIWDFVSKYDTNGLR